MLGLGKAFPKKIENLAKEAGLNSVRCFQRANLPSLVTGDKVYFDPSADGTGVVVSAEPRRNEFLRPGFKGKLKPVAANIDRVLLVVASSPEPFTNLIDRYLVAIESLSLNAAIVLNKTDLINDSNRANLDNIMSIYTALEYPVFQVAAATGEGNSISKPSPMVLIKRAFAASSSGLISSARMARKRISVPSSSAPIKRE